MPEEPCQTRWIIDRSIRFLQERDPSRPIFLKTSFVDPHDPYDPPARFLERIDSEAVPGPIASADAALQQALALLAHPEERTKLFGRADSGRLERNLRDLLIQLEWQRFDPLPRRRKHPTAMH